MGLITGLITLPLAPVRGVVWIGERLHEQALREMTDPAVIRRRLQQVEIDRASGVISDEDAAVYEEELVQQMLAARGYSSGLEG